MSLSNKNRAWLIQVLFLKKCHQIPFAVFSNLTLRMVGPRRI